MTDKMLKFVKIGQQTPPKRGVDNRKDDFNEIYDEFITQKGRHGVTWLLNFVRRQYSCNIIRKLLSRYTSLISFEAELHKGMLKADFQCFCYPVYIVYVVV